MESWGLGTLNPKPTGHELGVGLSISRGPQDIGINIFVPPLSRGTLKMRLLIYGHSVEIRDFEDNCQEENLLLTRQQVFSLDRNLEFRS